MDSKMTMRSMNEERKTRQEKVLTGPGSRDAMPGMFFFITLIYFTIIHYNVDYDSYASLYSD